MKKKRIGLIIILIICAIRFIPTGFEINRQTLYRIETPRFSFLKDECCMSVATFKSLKSYITLKYEKLDDYYTELEEIGRNGEKFKYRSDGRWVSYHWSSYEPDVRKIDKYFQDNNFQDVISIDDLNDLELETDIYKTEVLNLYNKAVNSNKVNNFGKFIDFQPVKVTKSTIINDYEWTFGYIEQHGRIENVYLNCKYDNVWLDEIKDRTEYQEQLLKDIENIKHYIVDNQTLKLQKKYDKDAVYSNLIATLDSIKKIEYND